MQRSGPGDIGLTSSQSCALTSSAFCEPWLAFGPPPKKLRISAGMSIVQTVGTMYTGALKTGIRNTNVLCVGCSDVQWIAGKKAADF